MGSELGGLLTGLGSGIAGLFGYKGAKETNVASAQQAKQQMDFQREMSNTAVQRRMADLKKAGINPILAGSKEASSPAGQQAPVQNKMAAALQNASSAATIAHTMATTMKTISDTRKQKGKDEFGFDIGNFWKWITSPEGWKTDMDKHFSTLGESANSAGNVHSFVPKKKIHTKKVKK